MHPAYDLEMYKLFFCVAIAWVAHVQGDNGECRFDADECSCAMRDSAGGVCWDFVPGSTDCTARRCKAGWTCTCRERTHLCQLESRKSVANIGNAVSLQELTNSEETGNKVTSTCEFQENLSAGKPYMLLGELHFAISPTGMLQNACTQFEWYLNGNEMGMYQRAKDMNPETYYAEYRKRSDHSMLELRPGDLIAFGFRDSSYYCYRYLTSVIINGTSFDSTAPGFNTRFAREWSQDWEKPDFQPVLSDVETSTNVNAFIPLRKYMLPSSNGPGQLITPGADLWKPSIGVYAADLNHQTGNFYFRLQVPSQV